MDPNARTWLLSRALSLSLAALGLCLALTPGLQPVFELSRTGLSHGEIWRLWTGHWVHFGGSHAFWDILLWLVLGTRVEARHGRRPLLGATLLAAPLLSGTFLLIHPELASYRGLSGLDSLLYAWACREALRAQVLRVRMLGAAALLLFAGKCLYEGITGTCLFADTHAAFVPLPWIHLLALTLGLLIPPQRQSLTTDSRQP